MSMTQNFGSSWWSFEEERYLTLVENELAIFSKDRSVNTVLVFPPLSSRFRFLTHKVVEQLPELQSCSVGTEPKRCTVVYYKKIARLHQPQQFTNSSKMEEKQVPDCIPHGKGRGYGIKSRGNCDNLKSSPTASRRPAQALYTPGAFSKQRKDTDNQLASLTESRGSIRNETFVPKSSMKIDPLNEKPKIFQLQEVEKPKSIKTEKYKSGQESNGTKRIVEAGKCCPISNSTESWLKVEKESISESASKQLKPHTACVQVSDDKESAYDITDQKMCSRPNWNTMNNEDENIKENMEDKEDNRVQGNRKQLCNNGNSINKDHEQTNENEENFVDNESKVKSGGHQNCEEEGKVAKQCNENIFDSEIARIKFVENIGDNEDTNKTALDNHDKGRVVDCENEGTVHREGKNEHGKECMNYEDKKICINDKFAEDSESNESIGTQCKSERPDEDVIVKDNKIALGNNERLIDSECNKVIEAHNVQKLKKEGSNVKVDEIQDSSEEILISKDKDKVSVENNLKYETDEMMTECVDKTKSKCEPHSKSKRKHKKEEKAKKKEEKLKKKQVKTKSEKIGKKTEVVEKAVSKKNESFDVEKKQENVKEVKNDQRQEQEEDDDELKIIRECKDTLLKLSVCDDFGGIQDKNSEEIGSKSNNDAEGEVDDWEKEWDDDGECLDADHLAELDEQIDTKNIQIVKSQINYLSFKPNDIVLENRAFDHVVEIYNFSSEFKSEDIKKALPHFEFNLNWVDDTHALAIFSNAKTAQQAIQQCSNPMLKLRSLSEGTQESKLKAKRTIDLLQPYKERPKTTKLVANRLVAGALGVKSKMSKEEKHLEREKIKAEREKKQNKEKQKRDLWERDDV